MTLLKQCLIQLISTLILGKKTFSSTTSLNRHLKYIDCQKPLPETKCEKCDKIFASNFNYERHVKIKHKN